MHIVKRAVLAAPLTAVGLGLGALPALAAPAGPSHGSKAQALTVVIKDVSTADGSEPAFVGPGGVGAKSLFTAHVGKPVVLKVVNRSATLHSFTVAGLGVNAIIVPGATVKVTFKPKKAGSIAWLCTPPCGEYVMATSGYMRGTFKVVK